MGTFSDRHHSALLKWQARCSCCKLVWLIRSAGCRNTRTNRKQCMPVAFEWPRRQMGVQRQRSLRQACIAGQSRITHRGALQTFSYALHCDTVIIIECIEHKSQSLLAPLACLNLFTQALHTFHMQTRGFPLACPEPCLAPFDAHTLNRPDIRIPADV